jgi:hypothetical protein
MANDNTLAHNRVLALATLLKEALSIDHDLADGLCQHAKQKTVRKQLKEYQRPGGHLIFELERELASYLARLKATTGAGARKAMETSAPACGAPQPKKKRPTAL